MSASSLGDLAEFLNVIVQTQSRLDTTWMLFLSINSTIIGAVIIIKRKFNVLEKAVATFVYTILTLLNMLVMNNIINQLHALYKDLENLSYAIDSAGYNIIEYFTSIEKNNHIWASVYFIPTVYLCFYVLTVLCIIYDEKFTLTDK